MHTLLIGKDNKFITTNGERIVQRSKGAHTIEILVENEYNGVKMNECLAVLFYKLPVSGSWHPLELTPSDELYLDKYTTYQFSADTWLTSERGDVQLEMKFFNVELLDGVNVDQYVRKVTNGVIHISSSEDWGSGIADSLLDTVDQRIIQLMMIQNRQDEMIEESITNAASSLTVEDGVLYLVDSTGKKKGKGADVVVPRIPDDTDGSNDGLIELEKESGTDDDNIDKNGNFTEL